jgi:hypothetical protein
MVVLMSELRSRNSEIESLHRLVEADVVPAGLFHSLGVSRGASAIRLAFIDACVPGTMLNTFCREKQKFGGTDQG